MPVRSLLGRRTREICRTPVLRAKPVPKLLRELDLLDLVARTEHPLDPPTRLVVAHRRKILQHRQSIGRAAGGQDRRPRFGELGMRIETHDTDDVCEFPEQSARPCFPVNQLLRLFVRLSVRSRTVILNARRTDLASNRQPPPR